MKPNRLAAMELWGSLPDRGVRKVMKFRNLMLVAALVFTGGCGTGPNIFTATEKQYWRIDTQEPDGDWTTDWTKWFETEEACVEGLAENQRCRERRM